MYRGRFAPSPTGPLHAGSLVAALASWLDARAHGGQWLVRIEDVDTPRTLAGATECIVQQLQACGLVSDEPVAQQSTRARQYQAALDRLVGADCAYPCSCSRKDIAWALERLGRPPQRHGERVYPGTCRTGLPPGHPPDAPRAWRFRSDFYMENRPLARVYIDNVAIKTIASSITHWHDRRLGAQQQDVPAEVGDFVLKRADACFTYQLAVVVDDAAQGITHVVRGVDLADNTARQIVLQRALGLPTPQYLHTPLVLGAHGEKLSKQNGAQALDTHSPQAALAALTEAARRLDLPIDTPHTSVEQALRAWVPSWRARCLQWANAASAP